MSYESVDKLQNLLAKNVFHYAQDSKKASGRALGTLVEIISFYLLKSWGLSHSITIEKGLIEYGNDNISHNVEYTIHPIRNLIEAKLQPLSLPITISKIYSNCLSTRELIDTYGRKNNTLLSSQKILRNSCTIGNKENLNLIVSLDELAENYALITLIEQLSKPYAMVECKRVGVEEGTKKGPQTIEKAKQGAYVAKTVSSLQKVRNHNGMLYGVLPTKDGKFYTKPYEELLNEIFNSEKPEFFSDFILTIGIVSNHGNWFTSENPNKELLVLSQAYDWLIFLTDEGISVFIDELLLNPKRENVDAKKAFLQSYSGEKTKNQFTKVQMQYDADQVLQNYFKNNSSKIRKWFNIITPENKSLDDLQKQLKILADKKWF